MLQLSPINRLRIKRFKKNKRGVYSLYFFFFITLISLFSELIANDKPLMVNYANEWYFPFIKPVNESAFGEPFDSPANFNDPLISEKIESNGFIVWPPIRFSFNTINYTSNKPFPSAPDSTNWLGTDNQGRDVLSLLLYGFRISLLFGIALTLISSLIGIVVGALQGYYGGWIDIFSQRFMEIWSGIPSLFLIILLASVVDPSFTWLLIITVLFGWMGLVDLIRAEFLKVRQFDFVRAARALGVSNIRIMRKHILPNAMVSALTFLPFILTGSITTLTSLDFLGFGLPSSYPSLGNLLLQGKNSLDAPWLGITSFLFLGSILTSLVFVGEAIRDAFNVNLS
ncbi:ABC transporter permease [Thorsellia kenyensis]|uniref:ABC transporter permease n=1 Tax=Thorsellia kenyensis TaxID=1549888 RepID=A0ABV6CD23_9GAMM